MLFSGVEFQKDSLNRRLATLGPRGAVWWHADLLKEEPVLWIPTGSSSALRMPMDGTVKHSHPNPHRGVRRMGVLLAVLTATGCSADLGKLRASTRRSPDGSSDLFTGTIDSAMSADLGVDHSAAPDAISAPDTTAIDVMTGRDGSVNGVDSSPDDGPSLPVSHDAPEDTWKVVSDGAVGDLAFSDASKDEGHTDATWIVEGPADSATEDAFDVPFSDSSAGGDDGVDSNRAPPSDGQASDLAGIDAGRDVSTRLDGPSNAIVESTVPTANSQPWGIAMGSDNNLWFTERAANKIGRLILGVGISEFNIPTANSGPESMAVGPDGNLWFVENNGNNIGRITTAGRISEFAVPTAASSLKSISAGSDGKLWFTEYNAGKIILSI